MDLVKKFINDHKGEEITKHEGNFSSLVWGTSCLLLYSPLIKKYFKGNFGSLVLLLKDKKGIGFFNFNKYKESTKNALDKYLKNKEKFNEKQDFKLFVKIADKFYIENSPKRLKKLNNNTLEKIIIKSFELLRDWQVITLFSEALDEDIIKKCFDKIKNEDSPDFSKFLKYSQLVDFQPFVSRANIVLLSKNLSDYEKQWVSASYLYTPPIEQTIKFCKKLINSLGGRESIGQEENRTYQKILSNKKKNNKFRKTISNKIRDLYDFIKITIFIRDIRKETSFKIITVLSNSIREVFSRLNYDKKDIIYVVYNDFLTKRYKRINFKKELKKRKKGFIVYSGVDEQKNELINFDEAKNKLLNMIFDFSKEVKEIRGTIAHKGFIRGRVKVILSSKDFHKFENNDILVTSMTRPEFVPIMRKSLAVITDEGGVTCHAAIISRELKKTCIIGTKIATRLLKDEDLVEVDANKGVVKILKRAK